jgi:hypothetical protein
VDRAGLRPVYTDGGLPVYAACDRFQSGRRPAGSSVDGVQITGSKEVTMSRTRLQRTALAALVVGLLVAAPAPAVAKQTREAALAQERYYMGTAGSTDPATAAALAQERYYSSYGEPEPLTVPSSPDGSGETPWIVVALSLTGALVVVAAGATGLHRVRTRRRPAARVTA